MLFCRFDMYLDRQLFSVKVFYRTPAPTSLKFGMNVRYEQLYCRAVGFGLLELCLFVIFEIKICILLNDFYTLCPILIILIWHLYRHAKQVCMKIGGMGPVFLFFFFFFGNFCTIL